jgi:hypothetical protein
MKVDWVNNLLRFVMNGGCDCREEEKAAGEIPLRLWLILA